MWCTFRFCTIHVTSIRFSYISPARHSAQQFHDSKNTAQTPLVFASQEWELYQQDKDDCRDRLLLINPMSRSWLSAAKRMWRLLALEVLHHAHHLLQRLYILLQHWFSHDKAGNLQTRMIWVVVLRVYTHPSHTTLFPSYNYAVMRWYHKRIVIRTSKYAIST